MVFFFSTFSDYVGSLALLAVLALAYGHLHRALVHQHVGEALLGGCFGAVAAAQMNMPIEPMDGLIIDMRNAPIILCAAFLNWRATLTCLAIAMATRLHIGGIGMWSGLLGMTLAALAGTVWAYLTRHRGRRGVWDMLGLSVIGSFHLLGAFILPEPAFTWFLTHAVFPLIELNLVSITVVALLIEAEQSKIGTRERLASAAIVDPDHGVMTIEAMKRELGLQVAAGERDEPVALLQIQLRRMPAMMQFLNKDWSKRRLGLVHHRLKSVLSDGALIASIGARDLIIPLDAVALKDIDQIKTDIRRAVRERCFSLPEGGAFPLAVDLDCVPWSQSTSVRAAISSLSRRAGMIDKTAQKRLSGSAVSNQNSLLRAQVQSDLAADAVDALFAKARARMMLAQG